MAATYTPITQKEFEDFLEIDSENGKPTGTKKFYRMDPSTPGLERTREVVYGMVVAPDISLRIYSSIVPGYGSRDKGEDAIRVTLWWSPEKGAPAKMIGMDRIVKRTQGWRNTLHERIDGWEEQMGPACNKCGAPTVRRRGRDDKDFFGCVLFPHCGKKPQTNPETPTKVMPVSQPTQTNPETPTKVMGQTPDFVHTPITVSQLHYLVVSVMHDKDVTLEAICAAASVLYGNPEAFRVANGRVVMHAGIRRWLPQGE